VDAFRDVYRKTMKLISYAQNQEDIVLYRALRDVVRGFYIDVGAQHPISDSVTKLFYERGWSGINIDPVPQWFELLQSDRPHDINLRLAAGATAARKKFFAIANTGLSTDDAELARQHTEGGYRADEMDVEVRTLDDICKECDVQTVHFLKIDVEGAEAEVIRGFAFDKIRPWIVLVEAVAPVAMQEGTHAYVAVETHATWEPLLLAHGYEHVHSDGLNRFYLANEHRELRDALSLQPNPLDAFIRNEEWIKHERILQLEDQVRELSGAARVVEQQHQADAIRGLIETAENRLQRIAVLEQDNARLIGVASVHEHNAAVLEGKIQEFTHQNAIFEIELKAQLTQMCSERDRYFMLLDDMLHSHSWRITAPLRGVGRIVKANRMHPKAASPNLQARPLPQRIIRKLLLMGVHIMRRHPSLHARARAVYIRIPGLHDHLCALARTHSADTAAFDPGSLPLNDKQLPSEVAEVHRRVRKHIEDQRRRPG
jgi:FkbM family methyltransferase